MKWYSLHCEFCGSNIRGEAQAVNLDGGVFRVCNSCARLGTPARTPGRWSPGRSHSGGGSPFGSSQRFSPSSSSARPPAPPRPGPSFSTEEQDVELRTDFAPTIKGARELLGLSQEELGHKINEKPSVIGHLETGSLKPDDALARKLEHFLKIQLFMPVEEEEDYGNGGASSTG